MDFVKTRPLAVFDFDGTLAPIVQNPKDAKIPASAKHELEKLLRIADIIILTGRPAAFVRKQIAGIEGVQVIGLHGNESMEKTQELRSVEKHAEKIVAAVPGMLLERKKSGFAIHYRMAKIDEEQAEKTLAPLFLEAEGVARIILGRKCFEFLPRGARTKSHIVARLALENPERQMVFVGDDYSDCDAIDKAARLKNFTGALVMSDETLARGAVKIKRTSIFRFVRKILAEAKTRGQA